MQPPLTDFVDWQEGLDYLGISETKLKAYIANDDILPAIVGRGWKAIATENTGPEASPIGDEGITISEPDERGFRWYWYVNRETGEPYKLKDFGIVQAWYLEHTEAYRLLYETPEGIDVRWLLPINPEGDMESRPESFLWPDYIACIMEGDNRTITKADLLFYEPDLVMLKGRIQGRGIETQGKGEGETAKAPEIPPQGPELRLSKPELRAYKILEALKSLGYEEMLFELPKKAKREAWERCKVETPELFIIADDTFNQAWGLGQSKKELYALKVRAKYSPAPR